MDTVIEQEPFTEHGKEDSKFVVSLEDARAASIQGIPGVYWTEETTEILLGEFAPVDKLQVTSLLNKHQYFHSMLFKKSYLISVAYVHKKVAPHSMCMRC